MKVRFVAPALAVAALFLLTASSAHAGLFGCGSCGCEPSCGAPAVVWGTCCAPQPSWCDVDCGCSSSCAPSCHRGLGLLSALKSACRPRLGLLSCHSCNSCEPACGCAAEPSCGCDAGCSSCDSCAAPACEPTCGAPAACEPSCGCAAPACDACEPACGCEPACDPCCKPRRCGGLLKKLFSRKSCCASACTVSCEPACGCAVEPSCGCN